MENNPLIPDRDAIFQLFEVHDVEALLELEYFADHDRETVALTLEAARRLARQVLAPAYKPMDEAPPHLEAGELSPHPLMRSIFPKLVDLGLIAATRPYDVGGQQLPNTVSTLAISYLMAANLSAVGYAFLTSGAAHLIESFGTPWLRDTMMRPMYAGRWTGTMALTEPHAGSSLADVTTTATPIEGQDGVYRLRGSKIFISGGQHDLVENIVHLTLARIDGAPAGTRGVSLFAVPKRRPEGDGLVPNDVHATQAIHKIGWRGLPSFAIDFGDDGDCRGWLVGEPNRGLAQMFQMMNEARILIGANAAATASVAYRQSLDYAQERVQGRRFGERAGQAPQVPLIEHADVRRMLLRQKAIVEGAISLVLATARLQDLSEHGDETARAEAKPLLDLLTPITKSFPAEWGFESNALALQIHGGYGYSSEYLPEAWLRDQKLNSIHEGTTGIQGLDLLGRKVLADAGGALRALGERIGRSCAAAGKHPSLRGDAAAVGAAVRALGRTTGALGAIAARGELPTALRHSTDYLFAASVIVVAWQWLEMGVAAEAGLAAAPSAGDTAFYRGKLAACHYWIRTELPLAVARLGVIEAGDESFATLAAESF